MTADHRRSKKGKLWQEVVDGLRMVDETIPRDLAPRAAPRPDRVREPYVRSPQDQALIDALRARQRISPELPWIRLFEDARGTVQFDILHPDPEVGEAMVMTALGVSSRAAFETMLHWVLEQCRLDNEAGNEPNEAPGEPHDTGPDQFLRASADFDQDRFNRLLGLVASYHPQNEIEAQLAFYLVMYGDGEAELHAMPADNLQGMDLKLRLLERTTTIVGRTIDRLTRMRPRAEQRHVIEHIVRVDGSDTPASLPGSKKAVAQVVDGQVRTAIEASGARVLEADVIVPPKAPE